jgi:recombination protein RecA
MAKQKKREQQLATTVSYIQQRWGANAVRQGATVQAFPHIPTGFAELDAALGIGGIPQGRITVLTGAPTSGKRTLAALILARVQRKMRRGVAYIDVGQTCDAEYLDRCGVALSELLVVRPVDGQQALDLMLTMTERAELGAIVFDHWAALEGDAATQRLAAGTLDHLAGRLARAGVTLLVLDEAPSLWASFLTTLGGGVARQALGHHATVRLALRREEWVYRGPDVRGYSVHVDVEKNKLGAAHRTAKLSIRFNGTVRGDGL